MAVISYMCILFSTMFGRQTNRQPDKKTGQNLHAAIYQCGDMKKEIVSQCFQGPSFSDCCKYGIVWLRVNFNPFFPQTIYHIQDIPSQNKSKVPIH